MRQLLEACVNAGVYGVLTDGDRDSCKTAKRIRCARQIHLDRAGTADDA